MDSMELDNVKAEKADAMRRYNRKQKLNYLFHVFVSLVLLFWSSKWIREVTPTIGKPLFPFILINVLILLIFILSHQKTTKQPDLYDEYVTNTSSSRRRITTQETNYDKEIICSSSVEIEKEKNTETALCPIQTDTVYTVNETEEEKGRELVVVDIEPEKPSNMHDKMSDVEFNVVVSTYIYKQKQAWWQQKISPQRKNYKDDMAVVLRN